MLQSGCCYKLCLRALHALAFPFPFPFPCFSLRSFTHSSKSALAFPFPFPFPGSPPRSSTDSSSFSPASLASSSWASSSSSSSSYPPSSLFLVAFSNFRLSREFGWERFSSSWCWFGHSQAPYSAAKQSRKRAGRYAIFTFFYFIKRV